MSAAPMTLDPLRAAMADLRARGHVILWCDRSVECTRCGSSGSVSREGTLSGSIFQRLSCGRAA